MSVLAEVINEEIRVQEQRLAHVKPEHAAKVSSYRQWLLVLRDTVIKHGNCLADDQVSALRATLKVARAGIDAIV